MGQQQLLLVILVTIIVGIATVVALNIFGSSAEQANEDAVRQDLTSIAATAEGYHIKPALLGGGGNSFVGMTFADISSVSCDEANPTTTCTNPNGVYTLNTPTANGFSVDVVPTTSPNLLTLTVNRAATDPADRVAIAATPD